MPSLLCRLAKNCKFTPHLRIWWDNAQEGLPEKKDDIRREQRSKLLEEQDRTLKLGSTQLVQNISQRTSWDGHVLASTQSLPKPPQRGRTRHGETAYIDMQKVRCALIQDVRGAREGLLAWTGFDRRDPAPMLHLSLIMLAELLRDLTRPENRADSGKVGSDIRLILRSEGDFITKDSFTHSTFFQKRQAGRSNSPH